jgi:4-diphosphocytidyl-2-C-methyl-D-erythritol kinase
LRVWAPAKVNLFLEVLGKRTDGYHELETVMVAVSLYDKLVFTEEPSGAVAFQCDDATLPQGPTNLVVRSALLLRDRFGDRAQRGVSIQLHKRIPAGAGLGGGSSDAAATLAALNEFWRLGLTPDRLADLGAEIGSDVPFFFSAPAAVGRGRGEQLTRVSLPQPLFLVLVCAQEAVSTAEVFRRLPAITDRRSLGPFVELLSDGATTALGPLLFNRLEATARAICPAIGDSRRVLQAAGLPGAMTGSGSAAFGLASDPAAARRAARFVREQCPGRVHVVRTLPQWYAGKGEQPCRSPKSASSSWTNPASTPTNGCTPSARSPSTTRS